MKGRAVVVLVSIPLGPDNLIPINYNAGEVCEIHLTLSCRFYRQSTLNMLNTLPPSVRGERPSIVAIVISLRWLAAEQLVLLGPSLCTRDNPVATNHTYY